MRHPAEGSFEASSLVGRASVDRGKESSFERLQSDRRERYAQGVSRI